MIDDYPDLDDAYFYDDDWSDIFDDVEEKADSYCFDPALEIDPESTLKEALSSLSSMRCEGVLTDSEIEVYCKTFIDIYGSDDSGFRHRYSVVCSVVYGFLDTSNLDNGLPPEARQFANNIGIIEGRLGSKYSDTHAFSSVRKLHDHVELEIQRLEYLTAQNRAHGEEEARIAKKLKKCEGNLADLEKRNKSLKSDLEKTQREYVAILGIFAAVVVAFSSGVNFSITSIDASQEYDVVRMAFIVSIVGAFVFNLLYALFTFVYRMVKEKDSGSDGCAAGEWGILGKKPFVEINKAIVAIIGFFFASSILLTFLERAWAL